MCCKQYLSNANFCSAGASTISTPLSSKKDDNGATASEKGSAKDEAQVQDLFAYLSTKYEVPKNTISSDFSTASSETRAGSKVCYISGENIGSFDIVDKKQVKSSHIYRPS